MPWVSMTECWFTVVVPLSDAVGLPEGNPAARDLALQAGEVLALGNQLLQQWRWLPNVPTVFRLKFFDIRKNIVQADLICPKHRATGDFWEAIAIDVDDVYVAGTNGYAVFEDARTFVDQRIQAALEYFIVLDRSPFNTQLRRGFFDHLNDLRVGLACSAAFWVDVISSAGFWP